MRMVAHVGEYFQTIQHKQWSGAEPVLDSLTYGQASTPGARATKATWDTRIVSAKSWGTEDKLSQEETS
jgi:hypothetical protein